MKVDITTHKEFDLQMRCYARKCRALIEAYNSLLSSLQNNPFQGVALFDSVRTLKMTVGVKGEGMCDGIFVFIYSVIQVNKHLVNITLLYVADKSEIRGVPDDFIANLFK